MSLGFSFSLWHWSVFLRCIRGGSTYFPERHGRCYRGRRSRCCDSAYRTRHTNSRSREAEQAKVRKLAPTLVSGPSHYLLLS